MKIRLLSALVLLVSLVALNFHSEVGAQGSLVAQVEELTAHVNALTTTVTTLQGQVATLQADDSAAKANVAALQSSVNKLDGNITAADLVGTYTVAGFQTELDPFVASGPTPATISSSAYAATFTFNADGTGSFQGTQNGWTLVQGTWSVGTTTSGGAARDYTWTYSGGIVTLNQTDGEQDQLVVGAGGRVLFNASANTDHTTSLFIATRLQ